MKIKELSGVGEAASKDYVKEVGNRVMAGRETEAISWQTL